MSINSIPHKNLYAWTVVLTVVTVFGGILAIISGIGIEGIPVTPDIPGGCILLLLGALLATGLYEGSRDHARWVQFGYTGIILILIFGVCSVIISGANLLSLMIEGEAAEPVALISSGFIWAALLAIPAYPGIRNLLFGCSQEGEL
ncbi:hypothetical protein [uncultured Methanospirillum sp.]|uniref:hypothetical protein n=1 Tax=uncultured Methanospirillum sp. TaxID=262503 RepID=UPI0029C7C112|nr:hypothetical protein [uncultured Methanospirillum sp.]